jgi:hypothetical protein
MSIDDTPSGFRWTTPITLRLPGGTAIRITPGTYLASCEAPSMTDRARKALRLYRVARDDDGTVVYEKSELEIEKFLAGDLAPCDMCGGLHLDESHRVTTSTWRCSAGQHGTLYDAPGTCQYSIPGTSEVCGRTLELIPSPRPRFLCERCGSTDPRTVMRRQ